VSVLLRLHGLEVEYCEGVYWPAEDTFLLADALEAAASRATQLSLVADVGSGTGLLALIAAKHGARVVATDIEPRAAACTWRNARRNGLDALIDVLCCDLLSPLRAGLALDLVVCNPPYLPGEWRESPDVCGGPSGVEVALALLRQASNHLRGGGRIYLVLSSLSDVGKLTSEAEAAGLRLRVISRAQLPMFEEIAVVEISQASGSGRPSLSTGKSPTRSSSPLGTTHQLP